jgi:UDP-glucose 4-epimerase
VTRTALVTGAAGAIGQQVVRILTARGWRVLGLGHGDAAGLPLAGWIAGEIAASELDALARDGRPDAILHLAGGSSVGPSLADPARDHQRTVGSTQRLLDWMHAAAPDAALVLASSAAVYGDAATVPISELVAPNPLSPYGKHKLMMEDAARSSGLRAVSLRLFSVYGPGMGKQLVWELCNRLGRGERALNLGGTGAETRDWLHIEDAAVLLVDAIDLARPGAPALNGCTGMGLSVRDTARAILDGFGVQASLNFSGETRPGDPAHLVGDPAQAAAQGLKARVPAAAGLSATARAIRGELKV